MAENGKNILSLLLVAFLIGCNQIPAIDRLDPNRGNIGDVIDIRDPLTGSLGTSGTVYFDTVEASDVVKWAPQDIFVKVPDGISGTVQVKVVVNSLQSNTWNFSVLQDEVLLRTMCFGDSIMYWGIPDTMQQLMDQDPFLSAFNPVVINQGKRGEKVSDAATLTRWSDILNFYDLDFAILLEGTNDVTDFPSTPMENIQQNITKMIDEILSTNIELIVCTLLPRVAPCEDSESPTTEEVNEWLRSYAHERGIPIVDVYDDFVSTPDWEDLYFRPNCLHPNVPGGTRIAELLRDKILELYLPTCTDSDGDGYGDPASPPCPHPERDCDDTNPNVNPGVIESPYGSPACSDGVDNDCDGLTDADDPGCWECTTSLDCNDGNPCTDDTCVDHVCAHANNTNPCDDGDACTTGDTCSDGTCVGGPPLECDDGNVCTDDSCDPSSGCTQTNNTASCDDSDAFTVR